MSKELNAADMLQILKKHLELPEALETVDLAIKALRKQIALWPTWTIQVNADNQTYRRYYCPRCDEKLFDQHSHCQNCGQKLDWSTGEEE